MQQASHRPLSLKPPFFEFGPKLYLYGQPMLDLALAIDESAIRHDVDIILTVGYTDIRPIAEATQRVNVFAPHMDPLPIGAGSGAVLAAVLYAMFHTLITVYLGGTIATISGLVLMVGVLIVKPTGLMGVKVSES